MSDLLETPSYYGHHDTVGPEHKCSRALSELPDYFSRKPVREWSLSDFLMTNNDVVDFIDGVRRIRKFKLAHGCVRMFANAWYRYLDGPLGVLRISTAEHVAKNAIRHATLAEQALGLAQANTSNVVRMKQVLIQQSSDQLDSGYCIDMGFHSC